MQFAGAYGETGVRYTLAVAAGDAQVLSRQVRPGQRVHTCSAVVRPFVLLRAPWWHGMTGKAAHPGRVSPVEAASQVRVDVQAEQKNLQTGSHGGAGLR